MYFSTIEQFNCNCGIYEIGEFSSKEYPRISKKLEEESIRNYFIDIGNIDEDDEVSVYFIASLNREQINNGYEKELLDFGFKIIETIHNSNSGNEITIYGKHIEF